MNTFRKINLAQKISVATLVFILLTIPLSVMLVLSPIKTLFTRAQPKTPITPPATPPITPPITPPPYYVPGDLDKNGIVNIQDYILLSNAFGTSDEVADINKDGIVNIQDYIILSNNFGKTN